MKKIKLEEAINLFYRFQNIFHSLSYESNFYYDCEFLDLKKALLKETGNVTVINPFFDKITFYLHKSYHKVNGSFYEIPYLSLRIFVNGKIEWELKLEYEIIDGNFITIAKATSLDIPSLESLYILTDRDLIQKRNEEINEALAIITAKYANIQYNNVNTSSILSLDEKRFLF